MLEHRRTQMWPPRKRPATPDGAGAAEPLPHSSSSSSCTSIYKRSRRAPWPSVLMCLDRIPSDHHPPAHEMRQSNDWSGPLSPPHDALFADALQQQYIKYHQCNSFTGALLIATVCGGGGVPEPRESIPPNIFSTRASASTHKTQCCRR